MKRIILTDDFVLEWNRIRSKVDGMRGPGVTNTPQAITVYAVQGDGGEQFPSTDNRRWLKISSNCTKDGTYNGKSATRNSTAFDESASGAMSIATYYDFASAADVVLVNYFESGTGSHILPVDCVVFGWQVGTTSTTGLPLIEIDHFFAGVFQVACTQTGGSDGSASAAATYTYTVKTQDGVTTLGTGVAVTGPRPKGLTNVGTVGIAYYDSSGALKLWSAGETPTTGACS